MAPASGRNRVAVNDELCHRAHRFDFFQAVRLLERLADEASGGPSGRPRRPVGEDSPPQQEAVRFRALPSHSFPAGSIHKLHVPPADAAEADRHPPEMVTTFLGLTGVNGVLPRHYTTLLIERVRAKDFALRDFLDLFHHRIVSLFYRAWEKYRFPLAYERAAGRAGPTTEDLFAHGVYCLLGLGTGGLRGRADFDDEAFLFYAGHFAHYPRCALSLECLLADYFELPVRVKQFHGQWLYLQADDQSSLPSAERPQGQNTRLGENVVVGERVWDVEGKLRVRLGPVGYADFRRFLPAGEALPPICQMVRTYVGPQFDFDVQLVLKGPEAPWCRLGGDGADASRLGWNTWVRCGEFTRNVSDAVFTMDI
ncbi:MAG: type VI secretion system baseplate subunit TssG [Planctomycetota bacterium]